MLVVTGCSQSRPLLLRELLELEAALSRPVPSKEPAAIPSSKPARLLLAETPYRLTPGDQIRVTILGISEGSETTPTVFDLRVTRDGTVRFPYEGDIRIAGMELDDAEAHIRNSFVSSEFFVESMFRLVVTVEVVQRTATSVFVDGAVATRGLIALPENERSVVAAVNRAGLTPLASGVVRIRSIRGREFDAEYDLLDPVGLHRALTAEPLASGDIVSVETAPPNVVYFTGLLAAGGGPVVFGTGERVTFLQALASAGGRDPITDPKKGILRRRLPTGEEVIVELALRDIETGKEPNFDMRPGDIVIVPQTFQTVVTGWFNQNLQLGLGASANVSYDPLVERRADKLFDRGFTDPGGIGVPLVTIPPTVGP